MRGKAGGAASENMEELERLLVRCPTGKELLSALESSNLANTEIPALIAGVIAESKAAAGGAEGVAAPAERTSLSAALALIPSLSFVFPRCVPGNIDVWMLWMAELRPFATVACLPPTGCRHRRRPLPPALCELLCVQGQAGPCAVRRSHGHPHQQGRHQCALRRDTAHRGGCRRHLPLSTCLILCANLLWDLRALLVCACACACVPRSAASSPCLHSVARPCVAALLCAQDGGEDRPCTHLAVQGRQTSQGGEGPGPALHPCCGAAVHRQHNTVACSACICLLAAEAVHVVVGAALHALPQVIDNIPKDTKGRVLLYLHLGGEGAPHGKGRLTALVIQSTADAKVGLRVVRGGTVRRRWGRGLKQCGGGCGGGFEQCGGGGRGGGAGGR